MEREAFRQRMQQYKQARENNPQLKYWDWKKIKIKPENRGKFNATKKKTGKTTEELTHSKNPVTRKRAIFAQNTAKWNKGKKKKK